MNRAYTAIAIITLIILDQLTKVVLQSHIALGESIHIMGSYFQLTHVRNTGIAFGAFTNGNVIFLVLNSIIMGGLGIWFFRVCPRLTRMPLIAIMLIVAGAIGNLIDRALIGGVTDFIDVGIGTYRWPAFNAADSYISIGAVMILIGTLTTKKLFTKN